MTAAPLKALYLLRSPNSLVISFPRLNDRGPIEGRYFHGRRPIRSRFPRLNDRGPIEGNVTFSYAGIGLSFRG